MEIKEILEERSWEEFLTRQPHTSFLHSAARGESQDKLGLSHHRFGTYQGGALDGICQALVGRRKLGSFVYVPRGPILKSFESGRAQETLKYLRNFAAGEKVDYLRVEPHWEANLDIEELFLEEGYRRAQVVTSQAGGVSLLLDLSLSEEDLLAPHPRRYLQAQFETLAPRGIAELVWANYQGDVLSAAITFSYGDTVTYVHDASVRSNVPISYFLLWEIIKEAKKDGYRYFDFWGIAPNDDPRHPWYGYSLFKKGFGGYQV